MEIALDLVRSAFPDQVVTRMPHHNPGFDIRVGPEEAPARYVEVKSTRSPAPVFLMSERERRFSATHAHRYSLLVITGVDLEARTHQGAYWYAGEVEQERFALKPLQWSGHGPASE
jgi:hypothetical protein